MGASDVPNSYINKVLGVHLSEQLFTQEVAGNTQEVGVKLAKRYADDYDCC